jgi:hypothetical protein
MALMLKTSRPILGGHGMHSEDRFKAAWDEMPLTTLNMSRKEAFAWDWKCRYELGLRDTLASTKINTIILWVMWALCPIMLYGFAWPFYGHHVWYGETLPQYSREHGVEYSKQFGVEVYCADGKFVTPFFHINPPLFTMTVEEL